MLQRSSYTPSAAPTIGRRFLCRKTYILHEAKKGRRMYFLAWLIIGLIIGIGWLTGELLKGGGFGPTIGARN